ncbi:MAG: hypothetical protein ACI4SM_02430 [Candidatus Gastranaerophilaceae bacterium]
MQVNKINNNLAKLYLIDSFEFKKTEMPTKNKPYCTFDMDKVDIFVKNKERALPKLVSMLENAKTEAEIVEGIYIADRMIDAGTKGIGDLYTKCFAKFNDSRSANVQTFLSGVYRKTLNPDAFGPLVKMMVNNFINPPKANFDPNEEVGGAVIEYIREAVKESKK